MSRYIDADRIKHCPFCGGLNGFYANLYGIQLYANTGESAGYEVVKESKIVRCVSCGHRIDLKKLFPNCGAKTDGGDG